MPGQTDILSPPPHLRPYRVMAEKTSDLPTSEDPARVRVFVLWQHLYPQRLQLGRIERPEREKEPLNAVTTEVFCQPNGGYRKD